MSANVGSQGCALCPDRQFSNIEGGTTCETCGARGVSCKAGVARLENGYWRPGGADAADFDSATMRNVFPCFNNQACLLGPDNATVECNEYLGYVKGGADNPKMAAFGDVVLDMARRAAELVRTTGLS